MAKNVFIGTNDASVTISATNIDEYFTVSNGSYMFKGTGTTFRNNNYGQDSTTAQTTLTAKVDINSLSFSYSYKTESGYDKFTITVGNTTILNAASGIGSSSYSGSLSKGQSIVFKYVKDGSTSSNGDECAFSNMKITLPTSSSVPRVIKQIYIGVDGVARRVKKAYIGINGIARLCYPDTDTPNICTYCDSCQYCDSCDSCDVTCEDTCESSCQDTCEVSCQSCDSCDSCDVTCEDTCESSCQDTCEGECQDCDSSCQGVCQSTCEGECQDCDSSCQGVCQSTCETSCESCQSCEAADGLCDYCDTEYPSDW